MPAYAAPAMPTMLANSPAYKDRLHGTTKIWSPPSAGSRSSSSTSSRSAPAVPPAADVRRHETRPVASSTTGRKNADSVRASSSRVTTTADTSRTASGRKQKSEATTTSKDSGGSSHGVRWADLEGSARKSDASTSSHHPSSPHEKLFLSSERTPTKYPKQLHEINKAIDAVGFSGTLGATAGAVIDAHAERDAIQKKLNGKNRTGFVSNVLRKVPGTLDNKLRKADKRLDKVSLRHDAALDMTAEAIHGSPYKKIYIEKINNQIRHEVESPRKPYGYP